MRSDRKAAWFLGAAAFLALAPGALFGLPAGGVVVGATRILAGEIPYRDFWTPHAPGALCLAAGIFAVLGRELVFQGLAECALWAACASVLFRLLRDAGVDRRLAAACGLVVALARWRTGVELSPAAPACLLVLLAWRSLVGGSRLRAGLLLGASAFFEHEIAAGAAVGTLAAALLGRAIRARLRPALLLAGSACAVALLLHPVADAVAMARALPRAVLLGGPGSGLLFVPETVYDAARPTIAFVQANVPREEPIYVGLERHDSVRGSRPILYFLCDRPPAVPWHELDPGVADREDVQADMLGWIHGRNVSCVVLWRAGTNAADLGAGSDLLDGWIAAEFAPVADYGEYRILVKRR